MSPELDSGKLINGKAGALLAQLNQFAGLAVIVFGIFISYLVMAEDSRAQERWEGPGFRRAVTDVVREFVTKDPQHHDFLVRKVAGELRLGDLATKADLQRLEARFDRIEGPLLAYLYKEGVLE